MIAWCEALIVHRNAEVERLGIGASLGHKLPRSVEQIGTGRARVRRRPGLAQARPGDPVGRRLTCARSSCAATSNAARVRVEAFWKTSAMLR